MLSPSGGKCWVPGLGVKREKVSESLAVSFQIFSSAVTVRHVVAVVMVAVVQEWRQEKSLSLHKPNWRGPPDDQELSVRQSHSPLQGTSNPVPPEMYLTSISAPPIPWLSAFPRGARFVPPELLPSSQVSTMASHLPASIPRISGLYGKVLRP